MNRTLILFVSCLLVPTLIGADPALASSLAGTFSASPAILRNCSIEISTKLFTAEAVNPALASGYIGIRAAENEEAIGEKIAVVVRQGAETAGNTMRNVVVGQTTRRAILASGLTALVLGILFMPVRAMSQTITTLTKAFTSPKPSVSLEDARRHENLLQRLMETSPKLKAALADLKSKQTYMQAMLANDKYLVLVQNDLTHSPRILLGTSAATPGPLKPTFEDVIARRDLEIKGPIKKVESLRAKRRPISRPFLHRVKELLKYSEEELKTLFLKGGYTVHFDAAAMKKSLEAYRLAAIDLENADAKAFELLEEQWQALEPAWYDLAMADVDLRRLEMEKYFKTKKIAQNQLLLDRYVAPDRLATQKEIDKLLSEINTIDRDVIRIQGAQDQLASHLVIPYLKGADPDKATAAASDRYRPLPPQVQPTLSLVNRIFLRTGQHMNRNTVTKFREALGNRLKLPEDKIPPDPLDPAIGAMILDGIWRVEGVPPSFPVFNVARDPGYKPTFEESDASNLLATAAHNQENLLKIAHPSPHQAELFTEIRRILEEIDNLKLDQLKDRVLRLYGQLGAALPIQISYQDRRPVDLSQNKLRIESKEQAIEALDWMLEATQDSNDEDVKTARTKLMTAQKDLKDAASESMEWLGKTPESISYEVPSTDGTPASKTSPMTIQRWEDPAFEFEERAYLLEKNALEMEKTYRRLHYLVKGRSELRHLLDDTREAALTEKPEPPKASPPTKPKERKDLTLPSKVGRLAFLGSLFTLAASAAPLIHGAIPAPSVVEWIVSLAIIPLAIFMMPNLMRYRFTDQKRQWIRYWVALIVMEGLFLPLGFGRGLALGAALALAGWYFARDNLTTHKAPSVSDDVTHALDRRTFIRKGSLLLIKAGLLWLYFPISQALRAVGDGIKRMLWSESPSNNAAGFRLVRWPLVYTPPQTGRLVRFNEPGPDGILNPLEPDKKSKMKYLVRWIGPNTDPKDISDAVYVFQTTSATGAVEDEVNQARQEVQRAQANLENVRTLGQADAVPNAVSVLREAQTRLETALGKSPFRDEPMPEGILIEIDKTLKPTEVNAAATAGTPMVLAYQKSSRAMFLQLTLSPNEAAALGTGMARPDKHMRLRFSTKDYGEIVIPVAAIQNLQRATRETATNLRERDEAQGGFQQIPLNASVLITQEMIDDKDVPDYIPKETLEKLKKLNSENPDSLESLTFQRFEEWKGVQKKGKWTPYAESLAPDEVLALAELQSTPAPAPHASAPQQMASQDVSSIQAQIRTLTQAQASLRQQRAELEKNDSAEFDLAKIRLDQNIRLNQGRLQALETELTHLSGGVKVRAGTGTVIDPRILEKEEKGVLTLARDRIARLLNVWSERQISAMGTAPKEMPDKNGVMLWDPHALEQVRDGQAAIRVRSALRSANDINTGPWDVTFPSRKEPLAFKDVVDFDVSDPVQNITRAALSRSNFSLQDVRDLIPVPGSLLPVRVRLPDAHTVQKQAKTVQKKTWFLLQMDYSRWIDSIFNGLAWTLGATAIGLLGWAIFRRMRRSSMKESSVDATLSDEELQSSRYQPTYKSPRNRKPPNLRVPGQTALNTLASNLATTYLAREHQGPDGKPYSTAELMLKRFGRSILSPEDAKLLWGYWIFKQNDTKPNQRIIHAKWTFIAIVAFVTAIATSPQVSTLLWKAYMLSDQTADIIRIHLKQMGLTIPANFLDSLLQSKDAFIVYVLAVGLPVLGILLSAWVIGQLIPAALRWIAIAWFKKESADKVEREFAEGTKKWNPKGIQLVPDDEIRKLRKDTKGLNDPVRMKEQSREEFLESFEPFCDMMVERAAANLWKSAERYMLEENPEQPAGSGNSATRGWRSAASARWWAEIMEDTALSQKTDQALIPYTDDPDPLHRHPLDITQHRIQYIPASLVDIAETHLHMDARSADLARREIAGHRLMAHGYDRRLIDEYMDRARVYWAIEEMRKRPTRAFIALDAYDLLGLAFQDTGDAQADHAFYERRGDVDQVLDAYHGRMSTLLSIDKSVAAELREKYSRETPMFRGYRYLAEGFGGLEPDTADLENAESSEGSGQPRMFNSDWADELRRSLTDPHTGKNLIRLTGRYGLPTFEALAIDLYTLGRKREDLAESLWHAYQDYAGYSSEVADQKVRTIWTVVEKASLRRYLGWLIIRRLQKSAPDLFKWILGNLSATTHRRQYDIRYLSDPAPIVGDGDQARTTNADLLIAELKYRNLLEKAIASAGPFFGDIDFLGDLALEINPQMGAKDAGLDARMVKGDVHLMALSEPSDGFAKKLGLRISTRIPEKQGSRVRVRSSRQADQLLPTAGRHRPGSVLEISPEPPHFARAVDPFRTDPSLYIIAPPNLYFKYAARLIFFNEVLPAEQREAVLRRMGAGRDDFERELAEIRPTLERMNVRVKIYDQWDDAILDHDVPAEDNDNSYNTIVILKPGVRLPGIAPNEKVTVDLGRTRLIRQDHITREAKALLDATVFGEGGEGANYHVVEGVTFSNLPRGFFELRDQKDRLLAFRYYHQTALQAGPEKLPAIYHSWMAVPKGVRGQHVAGHLSGLNLQKFSEMLGGQGVAVCNVEFDNKPSVHNIQKRGYKQIGEYNLGYVAKLFPKMSKHLRKATDADKDRILELLDNTYGGYNLTDFDPSTFDPADHYVWVEHGQIIAVMSAHKQHWQFIKLKAWLPQIIGDHLHLLGPLLTLPLGLIFHSWALHFVATIPLFGGLFIVGLLLTLPLMWIFNLKNHRFLKFGNVAFAPGHAKEARKLIEAAMAENNVRMAWGFFDRKGSAYRELSKVHTFGWTGLLNALAETKVHTYAYAFDAHSQQVVDDLNRKLQEPAARSRPSTFIPPRHLVWWLSPFAALSSLLLGTARTSEAATLTGQVIHQAAAQAIQNTTAIPLDYVAMPGDSWWRISQHLQGSGAAYEQLKAINPDIVNAGKAIGDPNMIHIGDHIHTGLTAPVPAFHPPAIHMIQTPISHFDQMRLDVLQWVHHLQPELYWIVAAVALAGILIFLWKSGRLRRPVLAMALAATALAHSVAPSFFDKPVPQKSAIAFVSGKTTPAATISPAPPALLNEVMPPPPAIAEIPTLLPPPPEPLPVTPHKKETKWDAWVAYSNDRLAVAAAAHAANQPGASVEQLRQQYLALYAQRQAEAISRKPLLPPPAAPVKPAKRRILGKIFSPLKKIAHPAGSVLKAVSKPIIALFKEGTLPPEAMDPARESLQKEIEDLIRSVKREQVLMQQLLALAQSAQNQVTDTSGEAARKVATYQALVDAADKNAQEAHDALVESQDVPDLAEKDRFENVFATEALWNHIEAGDSQLTEDLAEIQGRAADTAAPVKGTRGLNGRQKQTMLSNALTTARTAAITDGINRCAAAGRVHELRSLGQELHFLGLEREALQAEEEALLLARQAGILPQAIALFREPQDIYHLQDPNDLQNKNNPLSDQLNPLLENSEAAGQGIGALAQEAATLEDTWKWKKNLADSYGLDLRSLFPEEATRLVEKLRQEANARAAIRAAELALKAVTADPTVQQNIRRSPVPTPDIAPPDDGQLRLLEQDLLARENSMANPMKTEEKGSEGEITPPAIEVGPDKADVPSMMPASVVPREAGVRGQGAPVKPHRGTHPGLSQPKPSQPNETTATNTGDENPPKPDQPITTLSGFWHLLIAAGGLALVGAYLWLHKRKFLGILGPIFLLGNSHFLPKMTTHPSMKPDHRTLYSA